MAEHWESCECRKCDQKRIADLRAEVEQLREWKAKAIERARDEVLAEQASELPPWLTVFAGPTETVVLHDVDAKGPSDRKNYQILRSSWGSDSWFEYRHNAEDRCRELAGIEPEPEPDEPGPVPEWFASGCKKAGYGIHAELHWAGYIGDLCREALRQEGSDDGRN